MDFDVVIDSAAHYIRVTVTGAPAIGQLLSLIHLLGVESETWPEDKVLVDLRGVVTPFTQPEQFRIGVEAAASMSHLDRIASLVPLVHGCYAAYKVSQGIDYRYPFIADKIDGGRTL